MIHLERLIDIKVAIQLIHLERLIDTFGAIEIRLGKTPSDNRSPRYAPGRELQKELRKELQKGATKKIILRELQKIILGNYEKKPPKGICKKLF